MINHYCIECNIHIISYTNWLYGKKRCYSCANKGKNNQNYIDGRWNKKYYCFECNKEITYETAKLHNFKKCLCQSCCVKGYKSYLWKGGKPHCKDCGKELSHYKSNWCNDCKGKHLLETRKKDYRGKNNPMFGKVTQTKRMKYKGICMRSSWENLYAKYLDDKGIKWLYEPKTFDLGYTTYTPDFYLPKTDIYIEIKGYLSPKGNNKLKLFKLKFPQLKILVYRQSHLRRMKILTKGII